ncbi:hypothetical protein M422DRAFT_32288 [Sphaerobolus stellatus SS14]|uniref:BD-FAE-like domain-containing protein n=1 Tax=Sphaerobolus stellatus (strain SS14) TaxID=990650 RepID=A0A0C9VQP6_SPHS4|nr:hypothetical protein M422DRAFT_32288 [Sphaerobolus stellatus SS14]
METIAKIQEVSNLLSILGPTRDAFIPLLKARISEIRKTPKNTFKYGSTDRHQVDVYYPPKGTSNAPVLFFIYGGGFLMGSRDVVPGLLFDNIGSFFAQRGILTVIADYRLAPTFTYPAAVEDIRDAIQFVLSSAEVDVAGHGADKNNVYIAGHSAGGSHAATLFLNEDILANVDRSIFKGTVLISGAYGVVPPPLSSYYGPEGEDFTGKTPFGLLRSKSAEKLKELLPAKLLVLISERDAPGLLAWDKELKEEFKKNSIDFQEYTMLVHNHISPEVSLSSGEGEEWGEEVAKFIKA